MESLEDGIFDLFRESAFSFVLVTVNCCMVCQIGWLLHVVIVLSLSTFMLIVQPYKMNVLDGLTLAL